MYDHRAIASTQDQNLSKCMALKKIHNGVMQSLALVSNSICYVYVKGTKTNYVQLLVLAQLKG